MSRKIFLLAIFVVLFTMVIGNGTAAAMGQAPTDEVRLDAGDPVASAEFGRSVAMDGDLVAVGAGGANAGSVDNAGAVYLYKHQGTAYVPETKLAAPDATTGAEFGRAVAIQGNTVIVGARFAQVGDLTESGAAYVFRKYQGSWHFEQKITSPAPQDQDNFGRALAIQGNTLIVTARKENISDSDVGAAYVFTFDDGTWIYRQKLTASDPAPEAYFGQSVAIQGDILAIGARNANPNGAGAVYLFRQSGDEWTELAKVYPPDGRKNDQFAFSIAISGDVMVVGARRASLPDALDVGASYVYHLGEDSAAFVAKISASDISEGGELGQSVAFVGDAIAIGAWRDTIEGNTRQGAIYIFRLIANQWVETEKITASDGLTGDEFGYSLSAFGKHMVTGAHFADSTEGAAYVIQVKP